MAGEKRKKILELPLKILFNEEGVKFFVASNKKLTKYKLGDEPEQFGILFDSFSPPSVQKMLLINYISSMEVSRPEFLSKRQDLMDLTKLITYGTLYRRFDDLVFSKTLDSEVVRQWNKANPTSIIDRKTVVSDASLLQALEKTKVASTAIKQEILRAIVAEVQANETLLPEEKNIQLFLADKFLTVLRPFTWFILVKFKESSDFPLLLADVESILKVFMVKSKVAEYLSLMTTELAIMLENSNIQSFSKSRYKGTLDPMAVTYDLEMRRMIVEEMRVRNQDVFLSWKVTRERLQVRIFNKEAGYFEQANKPRALLEFYKDSPAEVEGSMELGLYYLSYLTEECQKVGVRFESVVTQVRESGLTVVTLSLLF